VLFNLQSARELRRSPVGADLSNGTTAGVNPDSYPGRDKLSESEAAHLRPAARLLAGEAVRL
jgi:hypothetical protein